MSSALHFVMAAFTISAACALALRLAGRAPPRLKLWIAWLGLLAWLVPWPLLRWPATLASLPRPQVGLWLAERAATAGAPAALVPGLERAALPGLIAILLTLGAPGLMWFALDCVRHRRTVDTWRRGSFDGCALLGLLPAKLARRAPRVRVVRGSAMAATTGFVSHTVWVGERIASTAGARTALIHECCHARAFDPASLAAIQLIRRAYWWNPLVGLLARDAALWLEAACDERCARLLGRRRYRDALARLLLIAQRQAGAVSATLDTPSWNLRRLRVLERPARIGRRELAGIALCLAALGVGACLSAPPADPRLGLWAEVGQSAPDDEPILRSFEDLGDGLTRFKADVLPNGTAASWSDHRCDGGRYDVRDGSGATAGWTLTCRQVDPLTVEVTFTSTDGSRRMRRAIDRISLDGETYTTTITASRADGPPQTSTREFWRLH